MFLKWSKLRPPSRFSSRIYRKSLGFSLGVLLMAIFSVAPADVRLVNISTRAPIQGGAGDIIAGFIIEGTGTQRVVIRGWDLEAGVDAKLTLRKFPSSELVASNDNWQDDPRSAEIPSHMISHYDKFDAALLLDLSAGAYTVTLSSMGEKGLGLVGIDAIDGTAIKLINISTRAPIQGGAGDVIAGFIIEGTETQRVVIRGWDLEPEVDAKLTIRKFPSSEFVASNDNWQEDSRYAEIPSHMISHYDKFDAALLLDLAAGAYTVTLSSVGAKGIGLVGVDAIKAETPSPCPKSQPTNCPTPNFEPVSDNADIDLGMGFDNDRGWIKQSICINGIPKQINASETNFSTSLVYDYISIIERKKAKGGGKFSIKGIFDAHADASYEKVIKRRKYAQTFVLEYDVKLGTQSYQLDPSNPLNQTGYSAIEGGHCYFRQICGDQYIHQVEYGGTVRVEMDFQFNEEYQKKEFSGSFGIGFAKTFNVCTQCGRVAIPVSGSLSAEISQLSQVTRKNGRLYITAYQEGGTAENLINAIGQNTLSCSLDKIEACMDVLDDVVTYVQQEFAPSVRELPAVHGYHPFPFEQILGVPTLISDVTPEIEQAREELATEYEQRFVDLEKVTNLLEYSLVPERQQKMTTLLAALENDVESLSEAGVVCFSDLGNCLAKECEAKKGLANYDPNELIAGFHPDDGLAAYYPLDGNANDVSGHERHGTIHKTVTPVADRFGNENGAYKFDGYIQVSDMRSFQFKNQSVTFSAWVIPSSSGVYRAIVSMGSSSEWISLRRHRSGFDGGRMSMSVYGSPYKYARSIESGNALIDNGWLHVVGIADYEEREIRLYINNVLQKITKGLGDVDVSNGQFRIGYNNYSNKTGYWKGLIDDVRIYERAISDSEIKALYSDR